MSLFSSFVQFVSSSVKRLVQYTWQRAVQPAVRAVAGWVGFPPARLEAAFVQVEAAASAFAEVLKTDLGPVLRQLAAAAQLKVERWLLDHMGPIGSLLVLGIQQLEELLGIRRPPTGQVGVKLAPVRVAGSKVTT
jgi:hypothetical protein